MNSELHARAFDLPGWSCPPRVRDIPSHVNSWGWIPITFGGAVVQDDLGYLWADGSVTPKYRLPDSTNASPGAIVCWTDNGLGVWVHLKSTRYIDSLSRLNMEPDRWIPIRVVLKELPDHVNI